MLIQFSVENYRSIRDRQTLSLEAAGDDHLEGTRVVASAGQRLLRSALIYGPNASGKSNWIKAIDASRRFIAGSAAGGPAMQTIPVEPYRLDEATEAAPTLVEWLIQLGGHRYRYGYTADSEAVQAEWLFRRQGGAREARLFTREGQHIKVNEAQFREGQVLARLEKDLGNPPVRPNGLALSVLAQWNGSVAGELMAWFHRCRIMSGLADLGPLIETALRLRDPEQQKRLLAFAWKADLGITGLSSETKEPDEAILNRIEATPERRAAITAALTRHEIHTSHDKRGLDGRPAGTVQFSLADDESEGTRKFIALSGPLHDVIDHDGVVIIDEFEARLHPLLTRELFAWFHQEARKSGAQLILATHEVGLMDPDLVRRDQVWFCSKNAEGSTSLFSLAEFDSGAVRPTTKFAHKYLLGLLGAVPKLALSREFSEQTVEATHD
jgi:hypothetical protein